MRSIEGDFKAAISAYWPAANHCARGVFNRHRAADFAFTAQGQAINAHCKFCRGIRCRGIACNHWRDRRDVARLVGQGDIESFAINLRGIEGYFETAISAHRSAANDHARGVFDRHCAANFAFTGQGQAINAHCKLCWGIRCGGIARYDWRDCRDVARLVGQGDVEGFAIGLCSVEGNFKAAVSAHRPAANDRTRGVFDRHRAADFAFTGQRQAINADRQISWRRRCCGVPRNHRRYRRNVACLVSQRDVKGFAIFLRTVEDDFETAISAHRSGANHHARGVFDRHCAANFAFTAQRQAINAYRKVCWRVRCGCVARDHWRDCRHIARLIGQGDVQGFAIGLCSVEGNFKAAISTHRPAANDCASSVFDRHCAANFAFTAQCQAINADRKVCWRVRCGGIARNHWGDRRDVARLVGQGDVEGFAIGLCAVEDDFKAAISPDRPGADHRARCVFHSHRAARLAFTGQRQTIGAHHQVSRGIRRRGIARHHVDRWRSQAASIGQGHAQGFAVGLRFVERYFEAAISTDNPSADWQASRIFDSNGAANLAFTGHCQTIDTHCQIGWRIRRYRDTDHHWGNRRDVACLVGQGDIKDGAIALRVFKDDFKTAISPHHARAYRHTGRVFDSDCAADFTFTGERQTIRAHGNVGGSIRCGGIARNNRGGNRHIAGFVGQGDVKGLAIFLRTVEDDFETAISAHRSRANHCAIGCFDRDGAAHFAFTGECQAISAHRKFSRRVRCGRVACNHRRDLRNVARLVGQRNVEGLAIGLCRVEGDFEAAVSAHRPGANHRARCVFNRHRAADFAFTGQRQAINAHRKLSRCIRCRGIACDYWRDCRYVARLVGQGDVEGFAIGLSRIEDDGEAAVSRYRPGADHRARRVFHRDRAARFTFTSQRQTIRAHHQVSRGIRCGGVACHHADRWRGQAAGIGQGDAQGFAVGLRGVQSDREITVSIDNPGANHVASRAFHRHGAANLAFTGHCQTVCAHHQTGWRLRCYSLTDQHRRRVRDVSGLVSQGDFQDGAITLRGVEGDFKTAVSPHYRRTHWVTGSVFDDDRAARLTFTGEGQAVRAHRDIGRRIRSRGVARDHAADLRNVARRVGQSNVEGFTVGLRAVEGDREIAISVHNPDTDLPTGCVFDDDRAVDFTFTGEGQAISADRQTSWRGRGRCIARNHRRGCRDVACLIGQGDVQSLAIGLCRIQSDFEAAISPDRPGAKHRALRVFDGNGAAHFAFTRQGQAIGAEDHVGWCFRCSGVAGNHTANLRDVARFVGQGDVKGFAVGLSSIQDDFEGVISPDNPSANL